MTVEEENAYLKKRLKITETELRLMADMISQGSLFSLSIIRLLLDTILAELNTCETIIQATKPRWEK